MIVFNSTHDFIYRGNHLRSESVQCMYMCVLYECCVLIAQMVMSNANPFIHALYTHLNQKDILCRQMKDKYCNIKEMVMKLTSAPFREKISEIWVNN